MIWVAAFLVHRYMVVARSWIERSVKELEDTKYALDQSAIVARTDTRGIIRYANDKFCEISKSSREELIGRDHRIINSGYHPKAFIRDLWETISSGRIWTGELRNRAKDGTLYWVDTTIVPFLDDQGRPYQYVAIRYDITKRKRSEELLREQAALARLGEMAAVVAHEVKNPLAGIRGALQVIGARMPAESRDRAVDRRHLRPPGFAERDDAGPAAVRPPARAAHGARADRRRRRSHGDAAQEGPAPGAGGRHRPRGPGDGRSGSRAAADRLLEPPAERGAGDERPWYRDGVGGTPRRPLRC